MARREWDIAHKKARRISIGPSLVFDGAGGRTRTGTPVRAADFESTASTHSATPATGVHYTVHGFGVNCNA